MKEMIYSANRKAEVLHKGEYLGYKFCIMNLGTHPTAYVECKLDDLTTYGDERLDTIKVHGGFTYLGEAYWDKKDETKYLGWDYAHHMDYAGYSVILPTELQTYGEKRWTTAEIYKEAMFVITQLERNLLESEDGDTNE